LISFFPYLFLMVLSNLSCCL